MSDATSVYKYYDASKVLIYVGITATGVTRNRQHNKDKEWWQFVDSQQVEHWPSRDRALERERDLIVTFRPPFNTQHNPDHEVLRAAYRGFAARRPDIEDHFKRVVALRNFRLRVRCSGDHFYTMPEDGAVAERLKYLQGKPAPRIHAFPGRQGVVGYIGGIEIRSRLARLRAFYKPGARPQGIEWARLKINYVPSKSEQVEVLAVLLDAK